MWWKRIVSCLLGATLATSLYTVVQGRTINLQTGDYELSPMATEVTDQKYGLLFSDSPEYVGPMGGILSAGTIHGHGRVYFYHVNDMKDTQKIAVVIENKSMKLNHITVRRALVSKPSPDYFAVGRELSRLDMSAPLPESVAIVTNEKYSKKFNQEQAKWRKALEQQIRQQEKEVEKEKARLDRWKEKREKEEKKRVSKMLTDTKKAHKITLLQHVSSVTKDDDASDGTYVGTRDTNDKEHRDISSARTSVTPLRPSADDGYQGIDTSRYQQLKELLAASRKQLANYEADDTEGTIIDVKKENLPHADSFTLPPLGKRLLFADLEDIPVKPEALTSGLIDCITSDETLIKVMMLPEGAASLTSTYSVPTLPKDDVRLRGTYVGALRTITVPETFNSDTSGSYIEVVNGREDPFIEGVDELSNHEAVTDTGNYGVSYQMVVHTTGKERFHLFFNPLGGAYSGSFLISTPYRTKRYDVGNSIKPYIGHQTIYDTFDLGEYRGGDTIAINFMPAGASNLPIRFLLVPTCELDKRG